MLLFVCVFAGKEAGVSCGLMLEILEIIQMQPHTCALKHILFEKDELQTFQYYLLGKMCDIEAGMKSADVTLKIFQVMCVCWH